MEIYLSSGWLQSCEDRLYLDLLQLSSHSCNVLMGLVSSPQSTQRALRDSFQRSEWQMEFSSQQICCLFIWDTCIVYVGFEYSFKTTLDLLTIGQPKLRIWLLLHQEL